MMRPFPAPIVLVVIAACGFTGRDRTAPRWTFAPSLRTASDSDNGLQVTVLAPQTLRVGYLCSVTVIVQNVSSRELLVPAHAAVMAPADYEGLCPGNYSRRFGPDIGLYEGHHFGCFNFGTPWRKEDLVPLEAGDRLLYQFLLIPAVAGRRCLWVGLVNQIGAVWSLDFFKPRIPKGPPGVVNAVVPSHADLVKQPRNLWKGRINLWLDYDVKGPSESQIEGGVRLLVRQTGRVGTAALINSLAAHRSQLTAEIIGRYMKTLPHTDPSRAHCLLSLASQARVGVAAKWIPELLAEAGDSRNETDVRTALISVLGELLREPRRRAECGGDNVDVEIPPPLLERIASGLRELTNSDDAAVAAAAKEALSDCSPVR